MAEMFSDLGRWPKCCKDPAWEALARTSKEIEMRSYAPKLSRGLDAASARLSRPARQSAATLAAQRQLDGSGAAASHEQEAEAVADRVMNPSSRLSGAEKGLVRCRVTDRLQTGEAARRAGEVAVRSTGQPLPAAVREFMERRFGHDFSKVRIHSDLEAAASADRLDALAYTVGTHIVFGRGQYAGMDGGESRRLLAHELTHVVQPSSSPWVIQRKPKTPTNKDTVTIESVYDEIKAKNPDVAKLVTPLSLSMKGKPPDLQGGPMQNKEEHHWVVDILSAQGFAGSQTTKGSDVHEKIKGGDRVTHHINVTWALPLAPDTEFAKTASSPREALKLTAAESLYHELLHAQIMMESDPHWTNPHTSVFQGYADAVSIANSKALDQERQDVKTQIGGMARGGGSVTTAAEISNAENGLFEFLIHEKYDADTEAKAFGKSYPNDFIAKQYSKVVARRLRADDPALAALTKQLSEATKKLFDKVDAQATQANHSTTVTPTVAPPSDKR